MADQKASGPSLGREADGSELGEQPLELDPHDVGEQVLFAVEVVVHRALGDACGVDDAVERGVVEAVGGELVEGGAENRLLLGRGEFGETGPGHVNGRLSRPAWRAARRRRAGCVP